MTLLRTGPPSTGDLPELLAERFRAAARRNPRFSLRAFARRLGIDHSTLSQVLRRKRAPSPRLVETVGKRLGLPCEVIRYYQQTRGRSWQAAAESTLVADLDVFEVHSTWPHRAILELLRLKEFRADSRWIARTLGLSVAEVNVALQRLLRIGRLEMVSSSRWRGQDLRSGGSTPTSGAAGRALAREAYELATEALDRVADDRRLHVQTILAVPLRSGPEFAALAERFLAEARSLVQDSPCDEVILLEVSAIPLTRTTNRKEP